MDEAAPISVRVFRLPKRGSLPSEYEDAAAVQERPALPFRVAVADGATESAFARAWAEQLAEGWVRSGSEDSDTFRGFVTTLQADWAEQAGARASGLPWYAAAKAEEGAFATFLGLSILPDSTWHAAAVGDCCLFQVGEDGTSAGWPIQSPEAFNHTPGLVPSVQGRRMGSVLQSSGRWRRGDAFLLATDAAAAWLMGRELQAILELTQEAFAEHIEAARDAGKIRNDDVTVVALSLI